MYRIIENRYDSYFAASTTKNTAIGLTAYKKWSVRKESHAQTICKKIFEKLVKKENEHYTLVSKGVYVEKYTLENIPYQIAVYSPKGSFELDYDKIRLGSISELADCQYVKAGYTNTYGLISFYNAKQESIMTIQIIGGEPETAMLRWLNYLGLVVASDKQKEADKKNEEKLDAVNVKVHTEADVKDYWDGKTNASFPITGKQLKEIFQETDQKRCDEVAALINKYSDKFEINTPERMAHFLGQIGAETGGFTKGGTAEWTCYKETGNWSIWFNQTWKEAPYNRNSCLDIQEGKTKNGWKTLSDVPKKYRCQAGEVSAEVAGKNLFSYVYRCEGGNGAEETQDGYRYRGHGFIHLTWKKQYVDFNMFLTNMGYASDYKGVISNPDAAFKDMEISCLSGMWFWNKNKLNALADKDEFVKITYVINSGGDNINGRKSIVFKAKNALK